ncbi:MAG TPA: 1,2-phenylacetyl-CoA epoxidase subunit PaaD [Actinomycetota bacterium]|nr:1,2-phenylacetyl-CoA epoxidase subunit PaaD [Actinomycetota bacterium]
MSGAAGAASAAGARYDDVVGRVWDALAGVADPEIPAVSVVDMGMIESVEADDGAVRVVVLPTFSGCPALDVIRADVRAAATAVDGVDEVDVVTTFSPPWTTDRITAEGRAKLRDFGLAPPTGSAPVVLTQIGLPAIAECPFCGSRDTRAESAFGPTPCRSVYYCNACSNPFEQFKPV